MADIATPALLRAGARPTSGVRSGDRAAGLMLMAVFPALFWAGVAHVAASAAEHALSPLALTAIGAAVFAVLACAYAMVAMANRSGE